MTVVAERAGTSDARSTIEEFERIAEIAAVESDAFRLEFINGRIEDKGVPDGDHNEILRWLQKRCMQGRADLWMYGSDQASKWRSAVKDGRGPMVRSHRTSTSRGKVSGPTLPAC